jgi:hypothetical protein
MVITARFASVCPCCSQRIVPGAKVEWSKGSPARHVACATGPASALSTARPARRSFARRGTWTGCSCGSVAEFTKPSDCWTCKHDAE